MMRLEDFETDGLQDYAANLARNIESIEAALRKEKATLQAVQLELEVRARQEA
jgi:hypothetical protein